MIFSRPILSDSQPKKMKNGVPISSDSADQRIGRHVVELQRDGEEEQRVELPRVPDHALAGGRAEQREQHVLVVRILEEAVGQRRLRALAFGLHLLEYRRLVQLEPDVDRRTPAGSSDSQNGIRQPHSANAFASMLLRHSQITSSARNKPERRRGLDPAPCRSRACRAARARRRRSPRRRTRRRARGPARGAASPSGSARASRSTA